MYIVAVETNTRMEMEPDAENVPVLLVLAAEAGGGPGGADPSG